MNATLTKDVGSAISFSNPDKSCVPGKTASVGRDKNVGIVAREELTTIEMPILTFRQESITSDIAIHIGKLNLVNTPKILAVESINIFRVSDNSEVISRMATQTTPTNRASVQFEIIHRVVVTDAVSRIAIKTAKPSW